MNEAKLDNQWSVWQHEFAHAFGLPEMYVCDAKADTPTNIMAKPKFHDLESCGGTGGDRSVGFYDWQSTIIHSTACMHSTWLK